jgi:cytochrome c peroxidase
VKSIGSGGFRVWPLCARLSLTGLLAAVAFGVTSNRAQAHDEVGPLTFANPAGVHRTFNTAGAIDADNPFFQDLGTNGRSCFTCHRPAQAWTITPAEVRQRFEQTEGLDPIFRSNDGSNCEGADLSTRHSRRRAFSMLLDKGLIRVGLPVPATAEFDIVDVDDPYRCGAPLSDASMFRRPLPTTNLRFLSAVMWDGRETVKGHAITADLVTQASHATTGHAQGAAPEGQQLQAIVDFEMGLFTAQSHDREAGNLTASLAFGGPKALSRQFFCIGINDPLGMLPAMPGACATVSLALNTTVFDLFTPWENSNVGARRAIARGQRLFNTRAFAIDGVGGLNGGAGDPVVGPIKNGTCTVCHNTPNAGDHSVAMPLNIGLADASRRTRDLPLYTLRNRTTGDIVQTTDPGRAMVTGKWSDVGKFKGPILRALAARAPYFHNGSAATLADVVEFYDKRFNIGLTDKEKADLVAFLRSL